MIKQWWVQSVEAIKPCLLWVGNQDCLVGKRMGWKVTSIKLQIISIFVTGLSGSRLLVQLGDHISIREKVRNYCYNYYSSL
jgi:UDP-2,3-diacylglucosamine pyrophosphatase LpxH